MHKMRKYRSPGDRQKAIIDFWAPAHEFVGWSSPLGFQVFTDAMGYAFKP